MSAATITIIITSLAAAGLIAWDIFVVFFNKEEDDSISEQIRKAGEHVLIVPLAFGVLNGHWFWPNVSGALLGQPISVIVLGVVGVLFALSQVAIPAIHYFKYKQILSVVVGLLLGHFLWPLG